MKVMQLVCAKSQCSCLSNKQFILPFTFCYDTTLHGINRKNKVWLLHRGQCHCLHSNVLVIVPEELFIEWLTVRDFGPIYLQLESEQLLFQRGTEKYSLYKHSKLFAVSERTFGSEITNISRQKLCCVMRNIFRGCEDCSEAGSLSETLV